MATTPSITAASNGVASSDRSAARGRHRIGWIGDSDRGIVEATDVEPDLGQVGRERTEVLCRLDGRPEPGEIGGDQFTGRCRPERVAGPDDPPSVEDVVEDPPDSELRQVRRRLQFSLVRGQEDTSSSTVTRLIDRKRNSISSSGSVVRCVARRSSE
jgi:hypothetical protein